MTPRLRTTGRLLCLRPLLTLALLLGPAASGSYAYAVEPAPTHPAAGESHAGSDPGEGRTRPGRSEPQPPDRPHHPARPRQDGHARGDHPGHEPSTTGTPEEPQATGSPSSTSPGATPDRPAASPTGHSGSASAAAPKSPRTPAASPSRTHSAPAAVPPDEPQPRDFPDDQEVRPQDRPGGASVDTAGRTPRQTVAEPAIPVVGVLPLGSGLLLVGLGVGFLALRLRRT